MPKTIEEGYIEENQGKVIRNRLSPTVANNWQKQRSLSYVSTVVRATGLKHALKLIQESVEFELRWPEGWTLDFSLCTLGCNDFGFF